MNENQEGSGEDKIDHLIKMLDDAKKVIEEVSKTLDTAKVIISDLEEGLPYLRPVYRKDVSSIGLSSRALYVLESIRERTVGELARYSKKRLLRQRYCGHVTADEIERVLKRIGVDLAR